MGEYLNFINSLDPKLNIDLQYNDFSSLKVFITEKIEELLSFRSVKIENIEYLVNDIMRRLISKYSYNEIMTNDYDAEIDDYIKSIYDDQNSRKPKDQQIPFPEKNEAINYIYKDVKAISYIFKEGFNIGDYSKNIRDSLTYEGYKDDDILEGYCNEKILEYVAGGFFDVRFCEEFKNMREAVTNIVVSYFNYKKKDARNYDSRDSYEYKYYDNRNNVMNDIFKLSVIFLDNSVNPRKLNSSSPEIEIVHKYLLKDMIRVNSTRIKEEPDTVYMKKTARMEKQERGAYAKKAAIVFAMLTGLTQVESLMYSSIHDKERKHNRGRYQLDMTSYDIDRISNNVQKLRLNNTNEALQLKPEEELKANNSMIDPTIVENFDYVIEGDTGA